MVTFTGSDDLRGATFHEVDLSGARFVETYLTGAVLRGVDVKDVDIDAPWIDDEASHLWVNGVDVTPYVETELARRFPGRELRRASDPDGLRAAWAAVQRTWSTTVERVATMPPGTVEVSVDGEYSFAQTLRHLVLATDAWLGRAIREIAQPFHPLGIAFAGVGDHELDKSIFTTEQPTYAQVLEARAGRVAMVRDYLAGVTPELLAEARHNPWSPEREVSVLSCLHVILHEEWEHHRFAVRDLDTLTTPAPPTLPS